LPKYPLGFACRKGNDNISGYFGHPCDFREAADPEVIYYDGKWYMYPSCGMAYISSNFVTWDYVPVEFTKPVNIGYAPTVTQYGDKFLLTASGTSVYIGSSPLGPFDEIGPMKDVSGNKIDEWLDPMLFTDDDGKLFAYWGYGPQGGGIKGAEVDRQNFDSLILEPELLIDFNPDHKWERFGDANEHHDLSFVEGVSVFKRDSSYYLIYGACGTVFRNYAVGCYRSDSPLGPFIYQNNNPIAHKNYGIVNGTGHGCLTKGPDNTVWLFYTTLIRRLHWFERRIGMDKCEFDSQGNILPVKISETPKTITGKSIELLPVTINKPISVSSFAGNNFGTYAVDNQTNTWWEPEPQDSSPTLEINFRGNFKVSACRIMWTETGLNHKNSISQIPVKFKLELFKGNSNVPVISIDKSNNKREMLIEYFSFSKAVADKAKITIIRTQTTINHGISDVTIFGFQNNNCEH
jgi:beta-xylosidase